MTELQKTTITDSESMDYGKCIPQEIIDQLASFFLTKLKESPPNT